MKEMKENMGFSLQSIEPKHEIFVSSLDFCEYCKNTFFLHNKILYYNRIIKQQIVKFLSFILPSFVLYRSFILPSSSFIYCICIIKNINIASHGMCWFSDHLHHPSPSFTIILHQHYRAIYTININISKILVYG